MDMDLIGRIALAVGASLVVLIPIMLWRDYYHRHDFKPVVDHIHVGGRWHSIYVRHVCSHCGLTVERVGEPILPDPKEAPSEELPAPTANKSDG